MSYDGFGENNISVGPWGGRGGARWDDGVYTTVRQVVICHGAGIDSIQFEYDRRGSSVWSDKHGGTGGVKTDKVELDYPDEFLVSIGGYYGCVVDYGPVLVRSLTFQSNRKNYGPFGMQLGTYFSFPMTGGKVVGFHGRSSWFLDSLGVYMKPLVQYSESYDGYGDNNISVGPWGGRGGARWDDGVYTTVRQVVICHGAGIDSIQFEYDRRGSSVWSDKHGGTGGVKTDKVELDYPDEFLVSIGGYYGCVVDYGPVLVRSLTFQSNRKNYGPFGMQLGTYFSFPVAGGKVVGFHGRSSWFLDSLGVYLKPLVRYSEVETMEKVDVASQVGKRPVNIRQTVSYGPWGGNGGTMFDDGVYTGVREIHLTRYGGIFSLRVCYDMNGQAIWGTKHGGSGGIRLDKISFDYPSEILTQISGFYGSTIMRGPIVVKSLTFHTNKRKYGPFGDEQGFSFSSGSDTGVIVGFHGRKGWFLDSIGVHVLEGEKLQPPRYPPRTNAAKGIEGVPGMVKEAAPVGLRPWGGDGGKPWDDGVFSGVKRILLTKGEAIYCIQIEYDRNGQSVWSVRHGGGSEGSAHMINFEYPQEVLTSVCGYYGAHTGDERAAVIRSLTFFTNKGKYGPFGEEIGTFFSSTKSEGKIVGFQGRSGWYLNAIGVHLLPWSHYQGSVQQEPVELVAAVKMMINRFLG